MRRGKRGAALHARQRAAAKEITVDVDFLHSERSYDIMLTVLVEDAAALEAYQKDPYHCGTVKPYMHAVRSASIAIDAEM